MTRLDKLFSALTGLPRSQARKAIAAGEATVAGEPLLDPAAKVADDAELAWNGEPLGTNRPRYVMLHKPAGTVCSNTDDGHLSILALVDLPRREKLHAAGRLDQDATGLVLLTDDGQWSHQITSPRKELGKRYRVTLAEPLAPEAEARLSEGILLRGEEKPTRPAELERLDPTTVRLTIHEGKYHQVKRMFAALGNRVTALHRESIGKIELDAALAPGEWRELTQEEVEL